MIGLNEEIDNDHLNFLTDFLSSEIAKSINENIVNNIVSGIDLNRATLDHIEMKKLEQKIEKERDNG